MDPTELRIGNYINTDATVTEITKGTIYVLPSGKHGITSFRLSQLKPIPLTEERLEKCKGDFRYEDSLIIIRVRGIFPDGCRHTRFYTFSIEELKYLHRFQNLYSALTGEELKIK